MRIFAGHDGTGCAYYRVILPLTELGKHDGFDVTLADGALQKHPKFAAAQVGGHDLIVGERWDNPASMGNWRRLRAYSRLVYELDDDVWEVEPTNWFAYSKFSRADVQDAVAHSAQVANLVTVTTDPLAEVMRQYNPNVAVIGNHIPGWVCDLPRAERARPSVGWAGGASHGPDVSMIAGHVRRFLGRFPGWDARLVGVDYRPTIRHERTLFEPWTHVVADPEGYYRSVDFDIGLAPLVPSRFAQSKSSIKALEYAARGIPVIATDFDPYRDFVLHGVTGFLVKRDHEWLKYMSLLAADDGLRESMGAKAREHARQFTIEQGWKLWAGAYEGLFA